MFEKLSHKCLFSRIEDDKLLENLVRETEKPATKPKTILDDLESELIFEKPEPALKKPKIKSIEVIHPPKSDSETHKETNHEPEMDADNFNFDGDFGVDDFSDVEVKPAATSSEVTSSGNNVQTTASDNLNQYIGDVSTFNFQFYFTTVEYHYSEE